MLVLSRATDEQIVIGPAVLTVIKIDRGQVKLGIEAPAEVSIRRAELAPPADPDKPAAGFARYKFSCPCGDRWHGRAPAATVDRLRKLWSECHANCGGDKPSATVAVFSEYRG